jgi:hypothetical protein
LQSSSAGEFDIKLEWRREAEGAYDSSESKANPQDRRAYYLERLEIVAEHLFTAACGIGTIREQVSVGELDLLIYMDICVTRSDSSPPLRDHDECWLSFWSLLKALIVALHNWVGDPLITSQMAAVVFVSCVILRRTYEQHSNYKVSDVDIAFKACAASVPFPIDTDLPLAEQMKLVGSNLQWFHEQLRLAATPRPRWW